MSSRILIIDPDEDQLTELKFILEEQGCLVETAGDGLEGLEKGKLFQPDLVITELLLNRLSGFEVSSRIAADAGFRAPVVFYTGFYRDEYARKEVTSKYGAVDYFIKPFQREALRKAVAGILGQREAALPVVPQSPESPALDSSKEEKEEKDQSCEQPDEDQVRAMPQPVHSAPRLEEMIIVQENSPLSAMDEETRVAENSQVTITSTPETVYPKDSLPQAHSQEKSAAPVSPQPGVGPAASPVVPDAANELSILASVGKSPAAPSIYKSRPVQVIAIMILLFLVFFWLKSRIPFFEKKSDYGTQEVPQQSIAVRPSAHTGSTPTPTSEGSSAGSSQEPIKEKTPPAAISASTPDDKNLGDNAPGETSTSTNETKSTRRALPREVRNPGPRRAVNLVISDVTGAGKPPFLRKSRRPVLSPKMIQSGSAKPVVIRIVVSQEGRVLEATPVSRDESNIPLSQAVLAAVQDWQFKPVRKSQEKTWTKYFSFRLARESN